MEGVKLIAIDGLLKQRRPISGAHSLLFPIPSQSAAPPSGNAETLDPNSSSNYKVLKSLGEPCMIVGTLNLPTTSSVDRMPPPSPCRSNCFSFSDDSASVCCDVLDFDVRMVGRKILVVAWNFIPLPHPGGFLEIVKWQFPADSAESSDDCSLSLVLGSVKHVNDFQKARHSVCGLLESISPVFVVPCTIGGDQKDSGGTAVNPKSLCGFVVQILACRCKSCCSNDISAISHVSIGSRGTHSFTKESFVYFAGSASSWHLAILKLVGNVISLSRLKKKLIYMGKEEKELIYLTTEETCLHLSRLHCSGLSPLESSTMRNRSSFGVYTGVIRGIYVQGMVVEVDEDVWLLLTDQLLTPPHSIRVGAVITVRNVHFVNPKFPWRKVLILGACSKTSISVTSFSPLETGCHQVLQSTSLLGKYIGSLMFPARFWALLIVQCFRKKFAGSFSVKEILGSDHKEGITQKYASFILSTSVIRPPQRGVFIEFCKHALCGCSRELSCPTLNLAVPLINFVENCELMWTRSLLSTIAANSLAGHFSKERESHGSTIRKIFPSEGSGVSLLGNLKISSTTGRLQLIDATCSIDVVVPDLPSSWNTNDIFEVFEYSIVLEGDPERICHLQMVVNDAFSCRNIFECKSATTHESVDLYVFFSWTNAISRITPVSSIGSKVDYMELDSGIFHLFLLTHKFPIRPKISGDSLISNGDGFFAEAMVLPWDLYLITNGNDTISTDIPMEKRRSCCLEDGFPNKRCKVDCESIFFQTSGSAARCTHGGLETRSCNKSHSLLKSLREVRMNQKLTNTTPEIPCLVTGGSVKGESTLGPGILFSTKTNTEDRSNCLTSGRKLLLEFNCETIMKYKILKIGSCYIIKHSGKESFCHFKDIKCERKVIINPDMHFWSLSFFSEEDVQNVDPSHNHSSDYCYTIDESSENCIQRKLVFHSSTNIYHDCSVDVNLQISSEAIHLFDLSIQSLKEAVINPRFLPKEIHSVYQPIGIESSMFVSAQHTESLLHFGGRMPEGNLVTVSGTVVALHCTSKNQCHMAAGAVYHLRSYQEGRQVIRLHISTGISIVKIDGVLCKVDYPIGLGLGSNATFHRLLVVSDGNHLMLTPVSFITINYVSELKRSLADQFVNSSPFLKSCGSTHTFPKSIYDKVQNENTLRFCCKVLAVHTVILGSSCDMPQVLPEGYLKLTSVSIQIAGFIIDDGLLPYCCWASSENAAKLLRLHEELPFIPHQRSLYGLEGLKKDELSRERRMHLRKILDKHQTITVKNYGSFYDSLCQDLQLYGSSDYNISPSDEELLKFFILNACSGPLWTVTGHMMDSSMVKEVEKFLKEDQPMLHSMPNILATEVGEVSMLAEARDILQSL